MKLTSPLPFFPRLLLLTSHLSLLTLLLVSPVFSQQRWERTYGGANYDVGRSVHQTQDGGFIVTGSSNSFGAGMQVYLIKTNGSGDTLWTRNYGGASSDYGNSVQQTQDGGYIVTGESRLSAQVYLVKTDGSGDTLWTKTYGGGSGDYGNSVQQTQDGGYIIAGYTESFGMIYKVYLIKTNASGDTLWTRVFGQEDINKGNSVQQTTDGGYIVAGWCYNLSTGTSQVYLVKTNAQGDTLWTKTYGRYGIFCGSGIQTTDQGYIITGYTNFFGNAVQVYLIKTNALGDTLWTKTYGGASNDWGSSIRQTSDGGYIIAGYTSSYGAGDLDVYLIKTNASGDTLWTKTFGGTGPDYGESVQQTLDGGYIIAGLTYSFGDSAQVYLIKTDANGSSGVEDGGPLRLMPYASRLTVSPNPFTSFATLPGHEAERFALYDISGRRVGTYKGDRIGEGLSAGVYFLRPEGLDAKPLRIVKLR